MTVESLLQSLLVHVVADEADAATEHEQRVDRSHVDVFLRFLTVSDQNKELAIKLYSESTCKWFTL